MTGALVYVYVAGWILTSAVAVLTASRDGRPIWLSILAGAIWPVLAVAAAQIMVIAMIAAVLRTTSGDSAGRTHVTAHVGPAFVKTV